MPIEAFRGAEGRNGSEGRGLVMTVFI